MKRARLTAIDNAEFSIKTFAEALTLPIPSTVSEVRIQDWSIAALPPPLNEWMGWIVSSLFIGKAGEMLIERLKR